MQYKFGYNGQKIEIRNDELLLDIGSGHNPHKRANILLEKNMTSNIDRSGKSVKIDKSRKMIVADALYLPSK